MMMKKNVLDLLLAESRVQGAYNYEVYFPQLINNEYIRSFLPAWLYFNNQAAISLANYEHLQCKSFSLYT